MGLAIEILGLGRVSRRARVRLDAQRARGIDLKIGRGPYLAWSRWSRSTVPADRRWFVLPRRGPHPVWYPPAWTRQIVVAAMWPVSIAVVAAYIPGDMKRVSSISCWRASNAARGATSARTAILRGMILFGCGALVGLVYDRITLKCCSDPGAPPIPVGGRRNDIIAIVVGTILYLALGFVFHPIVIGLPAFGTPALGH